MTTFTIDDVTNGTSFTLVSRITFTFAIAKATTVGHAVFRAHTNVARFPSKALRAKACLVSTFSTIFAQWITTLFIAQFTTPVRIT